MAMEAKLSRWICQRCHRVAGIHVEGIDIPGETRIAYCLVCEVKYGTVGKSS